VKTDWVSLIGMLVYSLDMSNEAMRWWGASGVWFSLDIKS
jgi:hypothetical protein